MLIQGMLFVGHNLQTQQTWCVHWLYPSKTKGYWEIVQLVPNLKGIFFLNQTVVENVYSTHNPSGTNLLPRQKREPVILIVVEVVALLTALSGFAYGVIDAYCRSPTSPFSPGQVKLSRKQALILRTSKGP
jgi:hypothetical protein